MNNFITFEGIEGSGKSTQSKLLAESFRISNIKHIHTREPGGTEEAEKIRNIIVCGEPNSLDKITELLLINAARNEHLRKKIQPRLDEGHFVICDRYVDSTIAYQGYGQRVSIDIINQLQAIVSNLLPSLTFIFEMNIQAALARTIKRGNKENRFEKMDMDFHLRMQNGFQEIYEKNQERCVMVNADDDITTIHKNIVRVVNEKYNLNLQHVIVN